VDCKEFQEHVTPAVDKRLTGDKLKEFSRHAEQCSRCRNEFELESLTSSYVRSRLPMSRTPSHIAERISNGVDTGQTASEPTFAGIIRGVVESVYFKPVLAFAVGCIGVVLLLQKPETQSLNTASFVPGNVIHQSLANYSRVVNGEIISHQSPDKLEVHAGYNGGKTTFPVFVPWMKECEMLGGALMEDGGLMMAHFAYKHAGGIVYVYETCWKEVQKGDKIMLPAKAMLTLKSTGWYSESDPGGCSIILWTKDDKTLCSAVSRMPKDELLAYVSSVTDAP